MFSRLPRVTLVAVFGALAVAGCASAEKPDLPDGLPAVIPFGDATYDHPKELAKLPAGVTKTGGRLRSGWIAYQPVGNSPQPAAIWVTKDGQVWEYEFDQKMKFSGH